MDTEKLYDGLFKPKYEKRYLIDVFGVVDCLRKEINENLKAMGFEPMPPDIYLYPAVIEHLEKIKAELEERKKELEKRKDYYLNNEPTLLAEYKDKEKELAAKLQRVHELISNVNRDIIIMNMYKKDFEQNKDINSKDISDLNEHLLIDNSTLNESATPAEKRHFSEFIETLFGRIKNDKGLYLKVYDESEYKACLRKEWEYMKTLPVVAELVKASVFRTFEEIDAVLT